MIVNAYAYFDKKARLYSVPFFAQNDEFAKREFARCIFESQGKFSPLADYDLYKVGTFSTHGGLLLSCDLEYLTDYLGAKSILDDYVQKVGDSDEQA